MLRPLLCLYQGLSQNTVQVKGLLTTSGGLVPVSYTHLDVYKRQLRTRSAQDSRNILGLKGCELLPRYGQGYYMTPDGLKLYNIPMQAQEDINALVNYWKHCKPRLKLF